MTLRWVSLALLLLAPAPLAAQRFNAAGLQGIATFAGRDFAGGGPGFWWRSGHARLGATLAAGVRENDFAVRGEVLGHFILSPGGQSATPYAGGGLAAVRDGDGTDGYLVLVVGVELAPAARSGWALEAGLGGGFRIGAAWRWRGNPRATR